jgi:ABC-type phosphate transport system substrate-binding protein
MTLQNIRFILLSFLLSLTAGQAQAQELIANINLADGYLSRNEARLFFTMRLQHWTDNQPLRVFVLPDDNPNHKIFVKTVLGMFPYQLRRIWDRQLFSGTGQVPITVNSEAEMLQRVASTPGAIGYISEVPRDASIQVIRVN